MNQFKLRYAFLMLVASAVPVGCMTAPVASPGVAQVALSNPITLVALGNGAGGTITIDFSRIAAGSFKTKSSPAMTINDIDIFQVELVPDTGNPGNYNAPPPMNGVTCWMRRNGAPAITSAPAGMFDDGGALGQLRFTNVPNGTYRARVRAHADQDDNWSTTGDQKIINKNDPVNNDVNGPTNPWSVSGNTVTVSTGSAPSYTNALPNLLVGLNLQDAQNDPVDVGLSIINGGGPGGMNGQDL